MFSQVKLTCYCLSVVKLYYGVFLYVIYVSLTKSYICNAIISLVRVFSPYTLKILILSQKNGDRSVLIFGLKKTEDIATQKTIIDTFTLYATVGSISAFYLAGSGFNI